MIRFVWRAQPVQSVLRLLPGSETDSMDVVVYDQAENRSPCCKIAFVRRKLGSENKAKMLGCPPDGQPYATPHPAQGARYAP